MGAIIELDVIEPSDVGALTGEVLPLQLVRAVEPDLQAILAQAGNQALTGLGFAATFDVVDARVVGFLSEFGATKLRAVNATTRRQLGLALAEGVLAGEGEEALARRVQGVFRQASRVRARAIARTEVTAAANFARQSAYEMAGDTVEGKRWLATLDSRTRRNHMRLHNQVRDLREPFRIPGTSKTTMYPGGFADVGENVNCRCVIVPVVQRVNRGDRDTDRVSVAKLEQLMNRWERQLEVSLRRAFREQERMVLRMLRARDRPANV